MSLTVDTSVAPAAPGEFNLLHEQELGSGGYGKVVQAIQTSTGQVVAAKLIPINRMKQHAVEKEIRLMEKLRECPYTIGLRGIQQDASYYYIYMEMAELGELFTRVITAGSLQEHEAQPYMQQLMSAVQHMHALGVVHRDLKLENVLLDRNNVCKVCDFGLAHQYELKEGGKVQVTVLREVCGSKSYCAPEVLEGRGYEGFPTDVWSCGICLFAMLAGFFPLDEASGSDWRFGRVRQAASAGQSACHTIYGFYERPCDLSKEASELIDGMLRVPPTDRMSVQEVLCSPWLQNLPIPAASSYAVAGTYDERPNYRGAADSMSMEDVQKLIAQDGGVPMRPVYRGGAIGKDGPAPALMKQNAFERDATPE